MDCQIWHRVGDVVVVIPRTREKWHGAHGRGVIVEVIPLVILKRAHGINQITGVNNESGLFGCDHQSDLALRQTCRVIPTAITKDDELERSGTGSVKPCLAGS